MNRQTDEHGETVMNIRLLAFGTRGDVQPYLALALGLKDAGDDVSMATTSDFKEFVESYDIPVVTSKVNIREFMTQSANSNSDKKPSRMEVFRQFLEDAPNAIEGADFIIYSPASSMAAPHIAEKFGIPSMLGLLQPYLHPTSEFPVIGLPRLPFGGGYNRWTYSVFRSLLWLPMKKVINEWRVNTLGLPPAKSNIISKLVKDKIPTLYGWSPSVLPKPKDWGEHLHVTGYWFLKAQAGYQPSQELVDFINAGSPPVYVGFGSMSNKNAEHDAEIVLSALRQAGVRGIIASGWHGLKTSDINDDILVIDDAPHDWLFPQMSAVIHHGGAGTTAAGLKSGVPSIIVPTRGDQPFWARRIEELGVGLFPCTRKKLNVDDLANAIKQAVSDEQMQMKAKQLSQQICREDGVQEAAKIIRDYIDTLSE